MIFNSIRQRRQWRLFFSKYNILGIKLENFHMRKYFRETPRIDTRAGIDRFMYFFVKIILEK